MSTLLHIETSTGVCSVALSQNEKILWHKENYEGQSHSVLLAKFTEEALFFAREAGISLNGIVVSCGPGSYTGLRIGVSTAKGIAYGLDVPLLAVNTLELMASSVIKNVDIEADILLCPMIDARRMEVYTALYDNNLHMIRPVKAEIIDENSFSDILENKKILCFGNGAAKCKGILTHPNISFIEEIHPLASDMASLAEEAFRENKFQDIAYFEPFYLKEFIATTPKNKVL
jgi:tRNA threonylcarbamoyladenosine biosynthesis protein TsaB